VNKPWPSLPSLRVTIMLISKTFTAKCRICNANINIFEYKGFEGGRYSSHTCEDRELFALFWQLHPRVRKLFRDLKEVT
jgi:hypothetical protein